MCVCAVAATAGRSNPACTMGRPTLGSAARVRRRGTHARVCRRERTRGGAWGRVGAAGGLPLGAAGMGGPDEKHVGAYTVEERRTRINRYLEKRKQRVWSKRVNYHCRQKLADGRVRVKGRFVARG